MAQDMGHANDLLKAIQEFAERYLPAWLVTPLIAVGLLLLLFKYFGAGQAIGRGWRWLTTRTDKRRASRRARFADHVESQMRRLGEKEEWRDTRYAELEAELEITGRRRRFRRTSLNSLRRVPSLSKALEECEDRIVLLEGEPGAGKSVAMRHLAQRMATRAMRRPSETSVIPVYVNLKTFRCDTRPNSADVRAFVMSSANAVRDRDVERFLDDEFDRGLSEGTWLFLFDSFDEIPDILSATEANDVIVDYADAVHAFLHGMNKCRGIVASREFRGPGRAEWPTFRVVPLSEKRKKLLVEKSELPPDTEDLLLGELPTAESGVQQMSGNPLFLGLLCEHMREGSGFPTNVHAVLETYIDHRLDRDVERLRGHFGVTGADVRAVAEEFAFLIADQQSLGLEVPKTQAATMLAAATGRPADELARALDALVYTKIARIGDDDSVTFSHRRLQEYFATCVVIREPDRVPVLTLLTSGQWRETAVTILQTQQPQQAERLLTAALSLLPGDIPDTTELGFAWPSGLLYLLNILAEGSSPALLKTHPEVPSRVGALLAEAWENGRHFDRKWVLEVCSVATEEECQELLDAGFASQSEWLRQESFAQLRRVPQLAEPLHFQVRRMLLDLSVGGRLRRDRLSVRAQLKRTPDPAVFERAMRLLLAGPLLYAALVVPAIWTLIWLTEARWVVGVLFTVLAVVYFFVVRFLYAHSSTSGARMRAIVPWLEPDEASSVFATAVLLASVVPFGMFLGSWFSGLGSFLGGCVVALLVFLGPAALLSSARGRGGPPRVPSFEVPSLGFSDIFVGSGIKLRRWKHAIITGLPLVFVVAFVLGDVYWALMAVGIALAVVVLLVIIVAAILMTARAGDQLQLLVDLPRMVRTERPSLAQLRAGLAKAYDANVACALFVAMHQKDEAWPVDVVACLHRVAAAMEKRDFSSPDLPDHADRRAWVHSPDVLDQLSIFLVGQRAKALLTPR
ncbi:NACHT domain-containing protein [Lentzea albidocapillata]|uniref:NACHT domain-containing protein n=1 Tax=Lentzea albidocapillata TaxID=40571 RepID=A0A1W2FHZ1_9PSEU|nr:NACHT domain-containing protein [Lentzea albidocapillata]SMD21557.1 NACHT domain-containing protein [Lentzea albidocapillata]